MTYTNGGRTPAHDRKSDAYVSPSAHAAILGERGYFFTVYADNPQALNAAISTEMAANRRLSLHSVRAPGGEWVSVNG